MKRSVFAPVLAVSLMLFQPVLAHTDESLDAMPSPHGGQVRAAGPYHLELVAKDGELILHVTDHVGQEIQTNGGEGKARIHQGMPGSEITIKLEPSQENLFTGSGGFQVNAKTVIVVFVKLPEEDAYAARFTPLRPKTVKVEKRVGDGQYHDHDLHQQHH